MPQLKPVKTRALRAAPRSTPNPMAFLSFTNADLLRSSEIAYEDGYADARSRGKDGFFSSSLYDEDARVRYLQGFKLGLRILEAIENSSTWAK